ncbi:MAG: hypothetical protein M0002_07715 [Rhodospirillales bacterium]|nr:hypothetical protein [Rhodospirillales bacterium]
MSDALTNPMIRIGMQNDGCGPLPQQVIVWSAKNGVSLIQTPDNSFQLRWVSVKATN